ncbi:MAG TPA: cobalamin-binding protein, partial [Verrucomicrobiae bacterium]|nr:cobalamin-binding protein [Verrucomicrobiae bacterium]
TVIEGFKEAGLDQTSLAVGGAPVSQMFADEVGADAYASDAPSAVSKFKVLMSGKSRMEVQAVP